MDQTKFTMNYSYPKNAWYVVARDVEIGKKLFARKICNEPLVIYRNSKNKAIVLQDACWHRLLPLSKGKIVNDNVQCGYHGLRYNDDGRCTFMPSQETINPSACVKSYPVVERHRYIWVWMGNPAEADESKVPNLFWNDHPDWTGDGDVIYGKCNYRLILDNLIDLTHETFIHGDSIGNDAVAEAPFDVTHTEYSAKVTRWMEDIVAPPFWISQLGLDVKVDRWQIINFIAPSNIAIDVGVAPAGTGARQGDRSKGVNGFVVNSITPETDTTCHYFWSFCRNYDLKNVARTHELRMGVTKIFEQDEDILEAQQIAIENNPEREFYNLNIDGGAMWTRRIIDKLVEKEAGQ
jgi:phenylpropionate dioxygenase-like ring-hydroxylating dioxygenase large terminal subunit